jgi:hypothetical protein
VSLAPDVGARPRPDSDLNVLRIARTIRPVLTKADLEALAKLRLEDSAALLAAGRASSAYYLAGYAVELALKACIARNFVADVIPDKAFVNELHCHAPEKLAQLAGLFPQLKSDMKADAQLQAYWGVVCNWSESSRYAMKDPFEAASLIQAIGDPQHGVFQWVKKHW